MLRLTFWGSLASCRLLIKSSQASAFNGLASRNPRILSERSDFNTLSCDSVSTSSATTRGYSDPPTA
jgi:hypothetical protein